MTDARDAIRAELETRRAGPDFRQRLRARIEADREILRQLEAGPDVRPASMLEPVTFADDDESGLRRVPMRPVDEAEDVW